MLTESERKWLERRCNYCDWCSLELSTDACYRSIGNDECPVYPMATTAWSAAEFEARVAAKLAKYAAMQKKHHCCVDIDVPFHCPGWQFCAERIMSNKELRPCEFEMLKGVRIEVEEEMNADMDK